MVELYNEDCMKVLPQLKDNSVDAVICDLPYGVLNKQNKNSKWDNQLDLSMLWEQYKRILKSNGVVILFGQGMFTSELMKSNKKMWKYNLIWNKVQTTGFLNANRMPLRQHEDIVVFYDKSPVYNPQMSKRPAWKTVHKRGQNKTKNSCYGNYDSLETKDSEFQHPTSIITVEKVPPSLSVHPTQKPVELLEYLINTYTNEGFTVLDNCMGSGTTGIACKTTNRNFIGIESDEKYFKLAEQRINDSYQQLNLFEEG